MPDPISRREFAAMSTGLAIGGSAPEDKPGPVEAPFQRDYPAPGFNPSWKKPQIHRGLVQDFVIYAHSDMDMVKRLLDKEPMLVNAMMDWGGGDWESALGAGSHMGRRDMVEVLLERSARMDLFCAAMMGRVDAVKSMLELQPKLIDARGPHGFSLHFHAQVGGPDAEKVLDYLQSIKKIEMPPNPFLSRPPEAGKSSR